jgi:hypothetical protein
MGDARRVRIGFALRPFARHFFDDGEQMGAALARRFSPLTARLLEKIEVRLMTANQPLQFDYPCAR